MEGNGKGGLRAKCKKLEKGSLECGIDLTSLNINGSGKFEATVNFKSRIPMKKNRRGNH